MCAKDRSELEEVWDTTVRMLRAGVRSGRIVTVDRAELDLPKGAHVPRREATYAYKRDLCIRCGTPIQTVEVANRTCYFCPTDQPR